MKSCWQSLLANSKLLSLAVLHISTSATTSRQISTWEFYLSETHRLNFWAFHSPFVPVNTGQVRWLERVQCVCVLAAFVWSWMCTVHPTTWSCLLQFSTSKLIDKLKQCLLICAQYYLCSVVLWCYFLSSGTLLCAMWLKKWWWQSAGKSLI